MKKNLYCGICERRITINEKYFKRRGTGNFEHKSCIQTVRMCNICHGPIATAEVPTAICEGTGFIHEGCLGFYNREVTEMKKELPFGFTGTPLRLTISSSCLICNKEIVARKDLCYSNGLRRAHKDCVENYGDALRYNSGKPQLRYILHYPKTIELLARVLEGGAAKYEEMNWKKGGNTDDSYIDAAMRHLVAFVNGGTFNEDYGTHHLGHAIWNLMTMFELNGHEIMDKEKFDKVIKELTDAKSRSYS